MFIQFMKINFRWKNDITYYEIYILNWKMIEQNFLRDSGKDACKKAKTHNGKY